MPLIAVIEIEGGLQKGGLKHVGENISQRTNPPITMRLLCIIIGVKGFGMMIREEPEDYMGER